MENPAYQPGVPDARGAVTMNTVLIMIVSTLVCIAVGMNGQAIRDLFDGKLRRKRLPPPKSSENVLGEALEAKHQLDRDMQFEWLAEFDRLSPSPVQRACAHNWQTVQTYGRAKRYYCTRCGAAA
jgi:hypothetical protein